MSIFTTKYADILLPVAIPGTYTYAIPSDFMEGLEAGMRVLVPFGGKKIHTGLVVRIHDEAPVKFETKEILDVLDPYPVTVPQQFQLFQWISKYYLCTQGEVMANALPSGLKLSSESKIQLHPDFEWNEETVMHEREILILEALKHRDELSMADCEEVLGIKTIHPYIKSLLSREAVLLFESIREKYSPKREKRIRLHAQFLDKKAIQGLFEHLEKKEKQLNILLWYLREVPVLQHPESNEKGLAKASLSAESSLSESSLRTMIKNEVFEEFEIQISRLEAMDAKDGTFDIHLSTIQQEALHEMHQHYQDKSCVLLQGVTGSGKTEIYIQLIQEALAGGSQVLLLLPEIALTAQIVRRLKVVFGGSMGVYHSKFSDNERVEIWKGILDGRYSFVVGVRSALYLPFDNLGLIIVDEEHESSYKQFDPAPRYHARDTAIMLAHIHKAKVLLGSATPSMESFFNASQGKYGHVLLKERYGEAKMPEMQWVDMRLERKKKLNQEEFSSVLIQEIQKTKSAGKQSIIFQNRRGYAPFLLCETCGWIPKCTNCAVSMTYHQYNKELKCHHCGYRETVPGACDACSSHHLKTMGTGTEKLEETLALILPEMNIQRLDLDTTRSKNAYDRIFQEFETGHTDIMVGTQMVSKGLDFDGVRLVGVVDADQMLHYPDFRAAERTYQLITQVAGRAGRRQERGLVVVQTQNLHQQLWKLIHEQDFEGFANYELKERETFAYPPFTRLLKISVRHVKRDIAGHAAYHLSKMLEEKLPTNFFKGPYEPSINRLRNRYLSEIMCRFPKGSGNLEAMKRYVQECTKRIESDKRFTGLRIVLDVDPY